MVLENRWAGRVNDLVKSLSSDYFQDRIEPTIKRDLQENSLDWQCPLLFNLKAGYI